MRKTIDHDITPTEITVVTSIQAGAGVSIQADGNNPGTGRVIINSVNSGTVSSQQGIAFRDEGVTVGTGTVANFIGSGVTVSFVSGTANIYITGSLPTSQFGDGHDGNVIISGTTSITEDMYYNNLTILPYCNLLSSGFKIFVAGTLEIQTSGSINADGSNGTNGSGSTGGAGGARPYSESPYFGLPSVGGAGATSTGNGTNNGTAGSAGTPNILPATTTNQVAPMLLRCGSGGGGGAAHGATAVAGSASDRIMAGYAGGNGGAGSGANSVSLGGGGGGSGGGTVEVWAFTINNAGRISARGGNGGNGVSGGATPSRSGNGGGGGGGVVVVYYRNVSGSGVGLLSASAGVAGVGGNSGSSGTSGTTASYSV